MADDDDDEQADDDDEEQADDDDDEQADDAEEPPHTATHMTADDDSATVQTRAHHADGFRTQRASQLSSLSSFLHKAV